MAAQNHQSRAGTRGIRAADRIAVPYPQRNHIADYAMVVGNEFFEAKVAQNHRFRRVSCAVVFLLREWYCGRCFRLGSQVSAAERHDHGSGPDRRSVALCAASPCRVPGGVGVI